MLAYIWSPPRHSSTVHGYNNPFNTVSTQELNIPTYNGWTMMKIKKVSRL